VFGRLFCVRRAKPRPAPFLWGGRAPQAPRKAALGEAAATAAAGLRPAFGGEHFWGNAHFAVPPPASSPQLSRKLA